MVIEYTQFSVLIDDLRLAADLIDAARDGETPHKATTRFTAALRDHADRFESGDLPQKRGL